MCFGGYASDAFEQKLGGGARASPPHKTLSGFDIWFHSNQPGLAVNRVRGLDVAMLTVAVCSHSGAGDWY
jgi:hypothetical protein